MCGHQDDGRCLQWNVDTPMEWLHRGLETIEMFVRGPNLTNIEHLMGNRVSFLAVINSVMLNAQYTREGDSG